MAEVRVTQDIIEALFRSAKEVRVSQDVLESLYAGTGGAGEVRVSQDVLEILYLGTPAPVVLMTQDVLEILYSEEEPEPETACFAARLAQAGVKRGVLLSPGVVAGRVT